MVGDKTKKLKVSEKGELEEIDGELVLSIEKLQEIQDELEKVTKPIIHFPSMLLYFFFVKFTNSCFEIFFQS